MEIHANSLGKTFELRRAMVGRKWDDLTVLGWATSYPPGWSFRVNPELAKRLPHVVRYTASGFRPSFEECLPKWTGGLGGTESRELTQ